MQHGKDNRQDLRAVVGNEAANILVVPQKKRTLRNLKVGTANRFGELLEQWHKNLLKLFGLCEFEQLLELIQEKHFL